MAAWKKKKQILQFNSVSRHPKLKSKVYINFYSFIKLNSYGIKNGPGNATMFQIRN